MDKFIQKLNFDFITNQRVLQLVGYIDSFKGKWNSAEKQENRYLKELRKIATIESIGSSTRIEGATLTDKEVQELLNDIKITKLKSRDEQEVVGYYEVLELIYDNYSDIRLSESYIKQLHQILLKYSNKDERHRGTYKFLSNKVVATYPTGEQRTIFATTEPALVAGEMQELVEWTNEQIEQKSIHQLIVIGSFVYDFLSIHPFQDGNGRLSRLLTTLCLLQNDYPFIQYISFENHIEQNKKAYYEVLMTGQKNRGTEQERIDKWLIFFLESLKTLTEKLEQKYDVFKSKGGYLNNRQRLIKDFIQDSQPIKVSDLAKQFPEIGLSTLKKDLQYLRDEQVLTMIGKGKGSVYVLNEKE
ncbi:Fic family protein [Sphingobacterium pedocola]|uniref:Fic family protein n=1 Tax=Sphingobacterium pedocola TaxID=2082722 RepID=A0ABR9T348_9SPHI|nr:Fic family protein [Sphingobacterium pedocola]MBE8719774.1 Fic family protein [Sphingobacterium pedocola]